MQKYTKDSRLVAKKHQHEPLLLPKKLITCYVVQQPNKQRGPDKALGSGVRHAAQAQQANWARQIRGDITNNQEAGCAASCSPRSRESSAAAFHSQLCKAGQTNASAARLAHYLKKLGCTVKKARPQACCKCELLSFLRRCACKFYFDSATISGSMLQKSARDKCCAKTFSMQSTQRTHTNH